MKKKARRAKKMEIALKSELEIGLKTPFSAQDKGSPVPDAGRFFMGQTAEKQPKKSFFSPDCVQSFQLPLAGQFLGDKRVKH